MTRPKSTPRSAQPYISKTLPAGVLTFEMPDGSFAHAADPSVPFKARREAGLEASRAARREAASLHTQLKEYLLNVNGIGVYSMVVVRERLSRRLHPADMFGYDAAVDYLGGLLVSLPADVVLENAVRPTTENNVRFTDGLLQQLATAEAAAATANVVDHPDQRNAFARFQLLQERQLDRMTGYYPHLRAIVGRVFSSIDEAAGARLGFGPADALTLAEVHVRWHENELLAVLRSGAQGRYERLAEGVMAMLTRDSQLVASGVSLADMPVIAVLDALSTPLGSLSVDNMSASNRLRTFPVVPLRNGIYLWARPYDFVHEALDWFDRLLVERGEDTLRDGLTKSRTKVTEDMTAEALAETFSAARTHVNLEYQVSDSDWAETDVVVELPNLSIAVEVKGHRLTEPGRAANPARVRTKFDELVTEPLRQSARARTALLAGVPCRQRRHKIPVSLATPKHVLRVVVMLDRVDPFTSEAAYGEDRDDADDRYVWIACLADLLMVTDILTSPAELYPYIRTRCEQTAARSPRIVTESDALGAWLSSREGAWPAPEGAVFMLEASSDAINAYFTALEMYTRHSDQLQRPVAPSTQIPKPVLDALGRLLESSSPDWVEAADAVSAAKPESWRVVERDIARRSITPRSRNQRKTMSAAQRGRRVDKGLTIKLGSVDEISSEGGITLTVDLDDTTASK